MYCPACGAPGQEGRFCRHCGAETGSSTVRGGGPAAARGNTRVTVNTGGPVVVAGPGVEGVVVRGEHGPHRSRSSTERPGVIIAALIFFPPLWPLAVYYAAKYWSPQTKWAVAGIFFWPLWAMKAWKKPWHVHTKLVVTLVFLLAYILLFTHHAPIALAVGIPGFIWALHGDDEEAEERPDPLREATDALLDRCNETIADIEGMTGLDLAGLAVAERETYLRGLDLRREATDLYDSATDRGKLALAHRKATDALAALTTTRETLRTL